MMRILKKNDPVNPVLLEQGFVVLINKPENWTSFDVVNKIRHALKIKKVGHAGTLDPFATGLLLIGLGKATKTLSRFANLDKTYRVVVKLGVVTDTYDRTGQILEQADASEVSRQQVQDVLEQMTGEMLQVPPMYSAKKVKGKPLYKLARKGKEVERKAQKVTVYQAKMISWQPPLFEMELKVSKGTYIRSYAHDLGKKLGVGAIVQDLLRTQIGEFTVDESYELQAFINQWKQAIGKAQ